MITKTNDLPDVQKATEGFPKLYVNKVGVRNMVLPIFLKKTAHPLECSNLQDYQEVMATISSYCDLNDSVKGINMSRIPRVLEVLCTGRVLSNPTSITDLLQILHTTHKISDNIYVKLCFNYFYAVRTPITKEPAREYVKVTLEGQLLNNQYHCYLTVETTEMSLCPCSKEMSLLINNLSESEKTALCDIESQGLLPPSLLFKIQQAGFGAHNQKSHVRATVELFADASFTFLIPPKFWILDLLSVLKASASCSTFALLKRPDEKYVTEVSYMGGFFDEHQIFNHVEDTGPRFVEDIARQAADRLIPLLDSKIKDFVIVVNNDESIHSNELTATAVLSAGRRLS